MVSGDRDGRKQPRGEHRKVGIREPTAQLGRNQEQ